MAWIAIGLMCLSTGTVGIRLLAVWRRTRERPELQAGIALLAIGPVGFTLTGLCEPAAGIHPGLGRAVWAIAAASLNLGTALIFAFTCGVFHALDRRMAWLSRGFAIWMALLWLAEIPVTGFQAVGPAGWPTRVADFMRAFALAFAAVKSIQHQGLVRRRLALGLGDAVASDRLLLWGIGIGSAGVVCGVDATAKLLGVSMFDSPALLLVDAFAGVSASVCLYLAFVARQPLVWLRDPTPA